MMERSKSLDGPWEIRQLNHVNKRIDKEPNQGGLIQLPSGQWWFVTHQGTGDWEGRAMVLLPVNWIDGWPIIGTAGADGIGNMVWSAKKPLAEVARVPELSDEFNESALPPQWEWNYQPRADKWSLIERPGFLRLHAFQPLIAGNLLKAGNTLTQRAMRTAANEVTAKLDLSGLADGESAGLCHFSKTYCTFGVTQSGDVRSLAYNENGKTITGPVIESTSIWLRSSWGFDGVSQFAYSLDGIKFIPSGEAYQLMWGNYRGDRIGIFNYNDKSESGYLDVDWFHYVFASDFK
jgi:beta-xylosidase